MKRFCLTALLLAAWTLALGQGGVDTVSSSAERMHIEALRQQELTRYAQQEQACSEKFFVNDCLATIKTQHRETLAQLQRREIALNDAERRRRAALQLELTQSKRAQPVASAPGSSGKLADRLQSKTQEKALAQSQSAAAARERAEVQAKKNEGHTQQNAAPETQAALAAKNQRLYQEKKADAARHKADIERRQKEKSKPQAAPLPDPS